MPTFPNPTVRQIRERDDVGTIWDAARVAGVKPGTIRVWVTRKKIEPLLAEEGQPPLYHLPTVLLASQVGPGRPLPKRAPKAA
ncbi:MAG: hypothetical protein HOZ81_10345 [Streptomyces sp.]|nr:hypothetical protein [Streptomyces sp.]